LVPGNNRDESNSREMIERNYIREKNKEMDNLGRDNVGGIIGE
jgi:hypothetical protein